MKALQCTLACYGEGAANSWEEEMAYIKTATYIEAFDSSLGSEAMKSAMKSVKRRIDTLVHREADYLISLDISVKGKEVKGNICYVTK